MSGPLSVTRARAFETCPWAFRETYIRKRQTVRQPPLDFGVLIHRLIQAYLDRLMVEKVDQAPALVRPVIEAFEASEGIPEPFRAEADQLLAEFAGVFRLDRERLWEMETSLAVDASGQPVDYHAPEAFVRGRADLIYIDGNFGEVHDWKSQRYMPPNDDFMADDLQARTYSMMLMALNPALVEVAVAFRYVRFGGASRTARFGVQDSKATLDLWLRLAERIEQALNNVEDEGIWQPTPGEGCQYCPVAVTCPLVRSGVALALPIVTDASAATFAAGMLTALDGARNALTEALKGYVNHHGPVDVNGLRYDFWRESAADYEPHRFVEVAKKHVIEPLDLMRVDTTKLKRALAKSAALSLDIAPLRRDKNRTSFKAKPIPKGALVESTGDDADNGDQ